MAKQLAHIYHNLSTLLEAGVPVIRSLGNIASRPGKLPGIFRHIGESARNGDMISDTMEEYPRTFKPFDIGVVRVGEESGLLPECFDQLGKWHDFLTHMRRTIVSGCIYPFFILHLAAIVAPLPAFILGATDITGYLRSMLGILSLIYVPVAVVLLTLKLMPRHGRIRLIFDRFFLRIPILGKALLHLAMSRFTRAFSIACHAGIPYLRCMNMALENTANEAVIRMFQPGLKSAMAGQPISEGFSDSLPAEFIALWEIGEETGDLDEVAERLAKMTGETAQLYLTELAKWLPRIIYFIVMLIMAYLILKTAAGIFGSALPKM